MSGERMSGERVSGERIKTKKIRSCTEPYHYHAIMPCGRVQAFRTTSAPSQVYEASPPSSTSYLELLLLYSGTISFIFFTIAISS